jgi:septation ring formation regulator EzrA
MTQTQGQTQLQQAMADIDRAHVVIARERQLQLETSLREAIALAGRIEKQIEEKRKYLATFGTEFPDTWNKRAAVGAEISSLTKQEFYLPEEIATAEARLEVLDREWSKLTARLTEISNLTAGPEHAILNLQVDKQRVMLGINDLRLALKGGLVGPTNGGAVRTASM